MGLDCPVREGTNSGRRGRVLALAGGVFAIASVF